jgi:bacteriocin-like protein
METLTIKHELIELSTSELQTINGGDKFMKDLGKGIGYVWAKIVDAYEYTVTNSETAFCI